MNCFEVFLTLLKLQKLKFCETDISTFKLYHNPYFSLCGHSVGDGSVR
jgi:hypothetical protein